MMRASSRRVVGALGASALVVLGVGLLLLNGRAEEAPAAGFLGSEFMYASELEPDLLLPSSAAPSALRRADAAFAALGEEGEDVGRDDVHPGEGEAADLADGDLAAGGAVDPAIGVEP
jgi:hypothetical protein